MKVEWIKVEERLPERGTEVLVCIKGDDENAYLDWYGPAHDSADPSEFCGYGDSVTHWWAVPK